MLNLLNIMGDSNNNLRGFRLTEENSESRVVLVDQDATLADFEGEFLKRWRKKYPDLPFVKPEKRDKFYLTEDYPEDLADKIRSIYNASGFIANLPVIPGALEALVKMEEEGFLVRICTSALYGNYDSVKEKHDWVEKNLGKDWVRKLIISPDKTMVSADYLIDDKPVITGMMIPSWEQIIFDAPYNRYVTDKKRLKDWSHWREILDC